jgi:hypothetical protein
LNLAKRVENLERVAGIGAYNDGLCICQPPNTFIQVYYPEHEQLSVERDSGRCERCGRKRHLVTILVVYDPPLPGTEGEC